MPTDFLYYWLVQPLGLASLSAITAVSFLAWRLVLGPAYRVYGPKPLAVAYAVAVCGHALLNFYFSNQEFTARVSRNVLEEASRWSIVPGWTLYMSVLTLLLLLPLLVVLSALAAALLRSRKYSYRVVATISLGFVVLAGVGVWWFSSGSWMLIDHLALLAATLGAAAFAVALTVLPFLAAIGHFARARTNTAT